MKKRVIISTNENPNYYFYLPMVVAAWKKIGFSVTLIAVSNEFTEALNFAIAKAKSLDKTFEVYQLQESEIRSGSIAQIARLYGFLLSNDYEEYVMTSDIDMIPMSDYFKDDDLEKCNFHGKDLTGDAQYPICYIGMKVINWYAYMQIEYGTKFETALNEELTRWTHQLKSEDFFTYWDIDQKISTRQANRLEKRSPELFVNIDRGIVGGIAKDRLDRAVFSWEQKTYIDLHAPHDIQNKAELFKDFKNAMSSCTQLKLSWLDAYRNNFVKKNAEKRQTWFEIFQPKMGNFDSHAPLLLKALKLTAGSELPVIEFGMGEGSTPRLAKYLNEKEGENRVLLSFENNEDYWERYKPENKIHQSILVSEWDDVYVFFQGQASVVFIDHAPGERRIIDIEKIAERCEYLVIHDTETDGAGDYGYEKIWHLFDIIDTYRVGDNGAMATLVKPKPVAG